MIHTRRSFVKNSVLISSVLPFQDSLSLFKSTDQNSNGLDISVFSKHLQFLDCKEAGQMAAEMGFNGIDLTVRPKGHVLPENAATGLPLAVKEIMDAGSAVKMITTNIESVNNPHDVDIINAAAKAGVSFYRTNWFKYSSELTMDQSLEKYKKQINELANLNKKHNIVGCYQNHAGTYIGSSFWEVHKLLESIDSTYFGTQYDIRHATVDGGYSWENGLNLLHKKIKMIVLKDFKWGKENGEWKAIDVPVGAGMVDFTKYFKLLKKYGLNPPVSLHLEYPLGGAEKGNETITVDKKFVFDAMKRDLQAVRTLWNNA